MVLSKLSASLALLSASVGLVDASSHMIFGGLNPIAYERVDPIVNPGISPSPHAHQIIGGNSFNASVRESDSPYQQLILVHVTDNRL